MLTHLSTATDCIGLVLISQCRHGKCCSFGITIVGIDAGAHVRVGRILILLHQGGIHQAEKVCAIYVIGGDIYLIPLAIFKLHIKWPG